MHHTTDLPHIIETIWTRCGIHLTDTIGELLLEYWTRIEVLAPMDLEQSHDFNQKYWDWYNEAVLGSLPAGLMQFLKESAGQVDPLAYPMGAWRVELNAAIDEGVSPLKRYLRVQALVPLLAPVTALAQLPFFRCQGELGGPAAPAEATRAGTPATIADEVLEVLHDCFLQESQGAPAATPDTISAEILAALEDEVRFRQRNFFKNGRNESPLSLTQVHYGSLLCLPLFACVEAGLIDAATLFGEMLAKKDSPLRVTNLYTDDSSFGNHGGVPAQAARFLVPGHRDAFIEQLPNLTVLDTGLAFYYLPRFMALVEADDKLFEGVLDSFDVKLFKGERDKHRIEYRLPLNRWLAYAQAAHSYGVVRVPRVGDKNRDSPPWELIDWYRQALADTPEAVDRATLYGFLAPFESSSRVTAFQKDLADNPDQFADRPRERIELMKDLASEMDDRRLLAELVLDEGYNPGVRRKAMERYASLSCDGGSDGEALPPWTEFYQLAETHPEKLLDSDLFPYHLPDHDPWLLERVWRAALDRDEEAALRVHVLRSILERRYRPEPNLSENQDGALKKLAHEAIDHSPDLTRKLLMEESYKDLYEIEWLEGFAHPFVDALLLKLCAASGCFKDAVKGSEYCDEEERKAWFETVGRLAATRPEDLLNLAPAQLRDVLSIIDPRAQIDPLSPYILEQAAKASSSDLHLFLADWLAPLSLSQLQKLGWLDPKFKRFEAVSVELLLSKAEPEALVMLEAEYGRLKSQTIKDRILDKLEAGGKDIAGRDDLAGLDLAGLAALAEKAAPKKMRASVKKIWSEALTEKFVPLTPALLQWLFLLLETTTADAVPRTARHILALLDREDQALLTLHLFESWFDNKGNAAQEWAALLVDDYGDDRLVPLFLQAVKHWNKKSKAKTNKVIGWLGRLGTTYALSQVKQIFEGRYSESIIEHSEAVLRRVADKRDMRLEELLEELTPTLDYTTEGLVLDAGGQVYHARFDTRGALVVVHENGKQTKSFPTYKKTDDPDKHKAAKAKLSFFKKSLKPILKQQAVNLGFYLHQGKTWPSARWQKLYLDHPLLAALGQSLIWDGELAGSERVAFRISGEMELLTVDDDTLSLEALETVRLWHPLEWDAAAVAAWKAHLADYNLKAMVDQVSAPVHTLDAEALRQDTLSHCQGHVANQASFRHLLEKNGFGMDDHTADGHQFGGHTQTLRAHKVTIDFGHTRMSTWLELEEEAAIDGVIFRDAETCEKLSLDRISPRIIAWMVDLMAQIAAKGPGYDRNWQSMM